MIIQLAGYPMIVDGHEKGAQTQGELLFTVNLIRWILLNESDWTQLSDVLMEPIVRQEWITFRQYLRDLPSILPSELSSTIEIIDPPTNAPKSWDSLKPS
jgi:hypothetical protein